MEEVVFSIPYSKLITTVLDLLKAQEGVDNYRKKTKRSADDLTFVSEMSKQVQERLKRQRRS